jgi:hypothetical protein
MTPVFDGTLELVGFVACIGIVLMIAFNQNLRRETPTPRTPRRQRPKSQVSRSPHSSRDVEGG